jgi:hypothetical protein
MTYNRLNEAQEQLQMANKILSDDYGIGCPKCSKVVPEQEVETVGEEIPQEGNIAKKDERITKIREIALQGLQDYAHNVDTEQYQFYKKIWLMCDKAVSEKESVGSENNT